MEINQQQLDPSHPVALEDARLAYLQAVINYNQAQFQLQWALGWQIEAH